MIVVDRIVQNETTTCHTTAVVNLKNKLSTVFFKTISVYSFCPMNFL